MHYVPYVTNMFLVFKTLFDYPLSNNLTVCLQMLCWHLKRSIPRCRKYDESQFNLELNSLNVQLIADDQSDHGIKTQNKH